MDPARYGKFQPYTPRYLNQQPYHLHCRHCPTNEDVVSYYKTDEFRMYKFKILLCGKRFSHDWTACPFTHLGERARRREPRLHLPVLCPFFKDNERCRRGLACKFAHGLFEYFMHPGKYRTSECTNGHRCDRGVCFFAHSKEELREEMTLLAEDIYAAFEVDVHMPVAIAPRQVIRALARKRNNSGAGAGAGARAEAAKGKRIHITDESSVPDLADLLSLDGSPASIWTAALNSWPQGFNGLTDVFKESIGESRSSRNKSSDHSRAPDWTREYSLWN